MSQNEIVINELFFLFIAFVSMLWRKTEEGGFLVVGTREGVFVCWWSGFKVAMGIVTGRRCRRV